MGCGGQGRLDASSHCRFCNPTCVAAAGHTPSGAPRHLPQQSWGRERASIVIYGGDGRAAAFRQSSRKFARLQRQNMTRAETMLWRAVTDAAFAGKRRSDPISRISFVLRERSSLRRTAARTRRRMRRSRMPRGMHGFDARDFGFFDFPTSSSSAGCRSSSSAFVRRCARHELPRSAAGSANWVRKTGTRRCRFAMTVVQSDLARSSGPHPIRRFAPPSPAVPGKENARPSRRAKISKSPAFVLARREYSC